MVKLAIQDLKEGVVTTETREPTAEELDLDPDKFSDIELLITLQKSEDRLEVSFDASATARLQGDRTLRWYDEPLNDSFSVTFKPSKEISEADREDEGVREYSPFDKEIDITREVRDTLLLAVPLRQIAPGGEEEELELEYGTTDEEDGRSDIPEWKQKLQQLRGDQEEE
jgi:uncharacterized protein